VPFSEILGHRRQIERIRRSFASARLAHAYLFVGPPGIGKRTVALGLLSALYCESLGDDFCGSCAPCGLVLQGHHPDVHLLKPFEGKQETTIDQVRALEEVFSLRAFYGQRKAVLVEEAETLNLAAQNAMLKILEEPRGHALFILLAPAARCLLPTVASRCQEIRFQPLSSEDVFEILRKKGLDEEKAALLSRIAQGSPGRALEAGREGRMEKRRAILKLLESAREDITRVLDWAEETASDELELMDTLDLLELFLRDAIVLQSRANKVSIMNGDLLDALKKIADTWKAEEALVLFDGIGECRRALKRNAQKRLALEACFLGSPDGDRGV
jgi:DNA polymerase-3 subunit delta'